MAGSEFRFEDVIGCTGNDAIPMGREGKPKEVADLAEFLLSNKSTYITGASFMVENPLTSHYTLV